MWEYFLEAFHGTAESKSIKRQNQVWKKPIQLKIENLEL